MPFCPDCQAEYTEGVAKCADCDVELVPTLPEEDLRDFIEFYASFDWLEVGRIGSILEQNGLKVLIRDLTSSAFPTSVGRSGAKRIAVGADKVEEAKQLIKTAIVDGEISPDGRFIEKK
jgi:hypothetical protein